MSEGEKGMNCPNCDQELLGESNFPLKRCQYCERWFEVQEDGSIVPLNLSLLTYLTSTKVSTESLDEAGFLARN